MLKLFSKIVSEKIFPSVFRLKTAKKIHKMVLTTLRGIDDNIYSPFINNVNPSITLIIIDTPSNIYISESSLSLPPQVTS
ncbi:MAG: hypothetical protein P8P80_09305 [Crocinitomicaceae bacterium]|nr:hypothetical protein [Crocinitomicaceae bacterium]MDG1735735.1 hypothetical protein [Crocinitomicaceae bacterium]MDG2505087.1 hypothetical protein [Crocinitomicaceae bacterium]